MSVAAAVVVVVAIATAVMTAIVPVPLPMLPPPLLDLPQRSPLEHPPCRGQPPRASG
jgi:hypothetical protein